ncbi:hypothetical protein [Dactylosporangium salmoneum]|uniref:Uncharacterized protein n=1 Tax=Dactylosporangium salmoneum TaxID=53361 RepID=A0ABN3GAF8_9ACTN
MTRVLGAALHVGDRIVDPVDGCTVHEITALVEYPGGWRGDHLRRAHGDDWHATVADHHLYDLIAAQHPVPA